MNLVGNYPQGTHTILSFSCYFLILVAPTIVSSPKDKIVDISIHRQTTLTCRADGVPAPKIIWKKEGNNTILPSVGGTLTLTKLKPRDIGKYKCIASNTEGNVSASVHLMLNCKLGISFNDCFVLNNFIYTNTPPSV
jgi:hypothetical protein